MNCLLHNISISMLYLLSVIILMFVNKCLYSHEMHTDVFRHKVPLCPQVTFKWLNEIDRKKWTQMCNMLTTADKEYMVIIDPILATLLWIWKFLNAKMRKIYKHKWDNMNTLTNILICELLFTYQCTLEKGLRAQMLDLDCWGPSSTIRKWMTYSSYSTSLCFKMEVLNWTRGSCKHWYFFSKKNSKPM